MASIFDVASYILRKCGAMSAMKLQKLCYYCQAWSLVWDDRELFPEEFEAWANGPVCPELFYKTQGKYLINEKDEDGNISNLTDNQIESIGLVLEHYAPHNAQWLSELTHMEQPWKDARKYVPDGEVSRNIITKESMSVYYGGL